MSMMNFMMIFSLGFSVFASQAFSAQSKCDSTVVSKIEDVFKSGKGVLLVAWGPRENCGDDDEACGDWADNLNRFAEKHKDKIEVLKVPSAKWSSVVTFTHPVIPSQASLFMAAGKPSYFYKDAIVEAQVYQAVFEAWFAKLQSQNAQFLPPQVTARLCK